MKTNVLKIGALSAALFGAAIVAVNAQTSTLNLQVTAGTLSCAYAISGQTVTMNSIASSFTAGTSTGKINSGAIVCTDLLGTTATWNVSMSASALSDGSHTIANTNISAQNTGGTNGWIPVVSGACTHTTGLSNMTVISTNQPIMGKSSDLGAVCTLKNSDIALQVSVPANQAVGTYTGTITFTQPL